MLKLGLFFVVIFSLSYISAHERKLSTYVNPGCSLPPGSTRTCDDLLLVHIRSEGASDTLHHIWDFSRHPSLMLALTEKNSSLRVDWPAYVGTSAHSVSFTSRPLYVISVVVAGIIEFNDTDDSGALAATNQEARLIGIDGAKWGLVQPITNDSNTVLMAVEAQLANHTDANGTAPVQITMGAFGGEKRDSDLPHMLHSSNMSQMDITLDHLPPTYPRSRFGVSLLATTSDPGNATLRYADTRKIDDEYAPGVFKFMLIIGGQSAVLQNSALDKDVTSVGEVELTDSSFDRSQIGTVEQFAESKRIIHETPDSRLVLDDITENYANNDLIAQQSQSTNIKLTPEEQTTTHKQSAQQELLQQNTNTQTNKLDKTTQRHNLIIHDQTRHDNQKIDGAYTDLTETLSVKSNGEIDKEVENRNGDYSSENSMKSNTFLVNYKPKTAAGQELFAEMKTIAYGKGRYSNNESSHKSTLKITPAKSENTNHQ